MSQSKKTSIGIAVTIAVLALGLVVWLLLNPAEPISSTQQVQQGTAVDQDAAPDEGVSPKQYTLAEVATHNSGGDCWTVINENVYNITSYIPLHPNPEITRACGVDATTLFTKRTTESGEPIGSGVGHDSSAQAQLAELQIGIVKR